MSHQDWTEVGHQGPSPQKWPRVWAPHMSVYGGDGSTLPTLTLVAWLEHLAGFSTAKGLFSPC